MLRIVDDQRVRILTIDRPEALNAFDEHLYDAMAEALAEAAGDDSVAVAIITGAGRAFSAGTDLNDMAARNAGRLEPGVHGFVGLLDRLCAFPKPLVCAVNGLALGIGVTMLGHADLAFMARDARLKCPFTSLGVGPEAASSYLFPLLVGRMNAAWMLLSSEWVDASQAREMGLVWRVVDGADLMDVTLEHAKVLARQPITSLVETKRLMVEPYADAIAAARRREDAAFGRLLDAPANREAIAAFLEGREPDFAAFGV